MSQPQDDRTARIVFALELLRSGLSMAEAAKLTPNRRSGAAGYGVSLSAFESLVQAGERLILGAVLRDRPPDIFPAELWPPEAVRAAIQSAYRGPRTPAARRLLREWLEGGGAPEG